MPKNKAAIGIDLDIHSIRTVKIRYGESGRPNDFTITAMKELPGNFGRDEDIVAALRNIRQQLSISHSDSVVTCVGGKQVYAAQMMFRRLPPHEMKNALKFEIRKNLPFDTASATIEYQILDEKDRKSETALLMVTAVANVLLQRYLRLFAAAGLPPAVIDALPLAVANILWMSGSEPDGDDKARIIIHIGPDLSTVVIDGSGIPFYNRTIYFSAAALYTPPEGTSLSTQEAERRINAFLDEISRSLVYYKSSYHAKLQPALLLTGNYTVPDLVARIGNHTGLRTTPVNLADALDTQHLLEAGRFDLAIALGLRGGYVFR